MSHSVVRPKVVLLAGFKISGSIERANALSRGWSNCLEGGATTRDAPRPQLMVRAPPGRCRTRGRVMNRSLFLIPLAALIVTAPAQAKGMKWMDASGAGLPAGAK